MIRSYRDLRVWQLAMDLVAGIYRTTGSFPPHETYGLTSQMRRAAMSIACNIAEGHGRHHLGDYLRHLSISYASVMELETQLAIAQRLGYIDEPTMAAWLQHTGVLAKMLSTLAKKLRSRSPST
jgi:four helix bundle protein